MAFTSQIIRKILYTGDYSLHSTALTGGCVLPEGLEVDTLIMCGLHAKHPYYRHHSDTLYTYINTILHYSERGELVTCHAPQLSKGVEFVKILNTFNTAHIPIFIDDEIMNIIRIMERLGEPILTSDNHVFSELTQRKNSGIIVTLRGQRTAENCFNIDFSLHEDFDEMRDFIRLVNPRLAVIVHCAKARNYYDENIEQIIIKDTDCRTQVIFAEDGEIYTL